MMRIARSRTMVALAAALLVATAVLLTNVFPFRRILAQRAQLDAAYVQLETLRAENNLLEAQTEALLTDVEVERLARESFGYVWPGERAYVIVSDPDATVPVREVLPTEPDQPWWDDAWDFLTGRDLIR